MKQSKILSVIILGLTLVVGLFTNPVSASTINSETGTIKSITISPNTVYSRQQTIQITYYSPYVEGIPATYYYNKDGWKGTLYKVSADDQRNQTIVLYTGTVYKDCVSACQLGSSQK